MAALGRELMDAVGRIVPVLPVPLIATVFVAHPARALSELELKAEVGRLLTRLEAPARMSTFRAATWTTRSPWACACCSCVTWSTKRRPVSRRVRRSYLLAYYANSITHLLNRWTMG